VSRNLHAIYEATLVLVVLCAVAWSFWHAFSKSGERGALLIKWAISLPICYVIYKYVVPGFRAGGYDAIGGLVLMLICGIVLAVLWVGSVTDIIAKPFASLYDGGDTPPEPKPLYSTAIAQRKRNQPLKAVIALREQLDKFPNDYEGIMMLADIQAEDLKDLASAEMTVNHFSEWDKAPPKQVAAALQQLADWHLKLAKDTDSARGALERIVERYPDTDMALLAKQRIAHLGGTERNIQAAQNRRPVFVPEGVKNVGLLDSSAHLVPTETPPAEQAATYVKHLQEHPDDTEAREKLAILYVNHYKRLDLATIELDQLINEPNHPPKRVAHWLNLLADLQVRGGADYDTVCVTLGKIIEQFPDFSMADLARSRLARLKLEFKALETTENKTLGVYEQNIGLKSKRSY
jgi:TolA-binding protein